jgi:hypothetical protein
MTVHNERHRRRHVDDADAVSGEAESRCPPAALTTTGPARGITAPADSDEQRYEWPPLASRRCTAATSSRRSPVSLR